MPATLVTPDRIPRAQQAAAAAGLDALLITPGPDLRYLTGYDATALERLTCLVVPAVGAPVLVVPELERPAAVDSPAGRLDLEIVGWAETADPVALVTARLSRPRRIGLADQMWAEKVLRFRAALPEAEQVPASTVLAELRMRKTPEEVEALAAAAAAIDVVHAQVPALLRAGRTEREVGRDIAAAILESGHETVDFVIVGAGPHAASPHHEVSDRRLAPGDAVVVDIGGSRAGYCSDATRTYVLGEPSAQLARLYDVLARAQQAARDAVRPGVSAQDVDRAARAVIGEAGYGERFIHRTGHGIGVETHEEPYIVEGSTRPLEPGMTFSVEPGIYLPDRYGARIEDIVAVTESIPGSGGVRVLNHASRALVVVGE